LYYSPGSALWQNYKNESDHTNGCIIVNLIRGGNKAQRHRAFITFLEEMDADCGDIPLHSDIRLLSAGKCLQRFFFALRN
jgi:hypothetical protein